MTPDEFRRVGHELIDWIADFRAGIGERPVMSTLEPGQLRAALPAAAPEQGGDLAELIAKLETDLVPGLTHFQHPSFFGYFPSNAELSSVLGDLLASGLAQIGLNWQSSPALTEVEEQMCMWMRQLLGLPDEFEGVLQDTASTASLLALLCARERTSEHGQVRGGLQAEPAPLIVYVSKHSHSSVEKAALLAGFGRDNVRAIACDAEHAMRVDLLAEAIAADLAAGRKPCAVVATIGTTATTALDPLSAIAELARAQDLWLHVDAAMAGSAMILPECRWMWAGIEAADSLVINPHKWLGAVFDCSLMFVRDPAHLIRVMSTNPSYLATATDALAKNYRDWGIPLGRRFRALKLWFLLVSEGAEAIRARLRRDLANAQWLAAQIDAASDWERLAPVPLQTVCVRHLQPGLEGEALDEHTLGWARRINASGQAYLTPAKLEGRWMVRVSIGALTSEREHVEALWRLMQVSVKP